MVPGEEAAAATTTRRRTSAVWGSFRINRQAAGGGGAPTATCVECGLTLCAGGKNGTSHLQRHTTSKRCRQQRAAELRRRRHLITAPTSAAYYPSPGPGDDHESPSPPVAAEDDEEEKDPDKLFTVDGIYIPELHDKLVAMSLLVNIDDQSSFAANSNYVPAVPQAASASTRWFINKTKERKKAETKKPCSPDDDVCGRSMSSPHSQTST